MPTNHTGQTRDCTQCHSEVCWLVCEELYSGSRRVCRTRELVASSTSRMLATVMNSEERNKHGFQDKWMQNSGAPGEKRHFFADTHDEKTFPSQLPPATLSVCMGSPWPVLLNEVKIPMRLLNPRFSPHSRCLSRRRTRQSRGKTCKKARSTRDSS